MNVTVEQLSGHALSDEEIVSRVLSGETALFEMVMRRYNQRLFRVVRGIVRDSSEAEDVVQEAYVNAYVHLEQFAGRAKFSTWLTRIAVNEALSRVRRSSRTEQLDLDNGDGDHMETLKSSAPDPEKQAVTGELRGALELAIESLAAPYRSVLMMRDVEEMSTLETAECLGLTEEAVKVRLHRARAKVREHLFGALGEMAPQAFRFDGARCDRIVKNVMERIT